MILIAILIWMFIGVVITIKLMPSPSFIEFIYSSVLWPWTILGAIKLAIKDRPK